MSMYPSATHEQETRAEVWISGLFFVGLVIAIVLSRCEAPEPVTPATASSSLEVAP